MTVDPKENLFESNENDNTSQVPGPPALPRAAPAATLRDRPRRGRSPRSPGERAPSRRIRQLPSSSIAAMSTTVEGRPGSSPPSIARSAPSTDRLRHVLEASRRRLAAEVGRGLEDRAHRPRQRAADQADAEPLGVLAAGERVAPLGVGDDQRHRPRQQGADRRFRPRPQPRDQLADRQRREVHDRRGLAVVAALEPVDLRDRRRRRADRRRARRGRRRGRRRRRRRRCSVRAPCAPPRASPLSQPDRARSRRSPYPADDDALDPRQVAPRLDLAEARLAHQLRDRLAPAPPPPRRRALPALCPA